MKAKIFLYELTRSVLNKELTSDNYLIIVDSLHSVKLIYFYF